MAVRFSRSELICLVLMAVFIALFLAFMAFFPSLYVTDDEVAYELAELAGSRLLGGAIFLTLLCYMGYPLLSLRRTPGVKAVLLCLPALLIAINNAPIIPLLTGGAVVSEGLPMILLLALACIGIGFFEETAFRGVIFPLILERLLRKSGAEDSSPRRRISEKLAVFLSIVLTSAVFAIIHLLNLFSGGSPLGVLLQIGYSFLIGAMCTVVLLKTRSIWFSVLVHAVYDFGGYLVPKLGAGQIWDTPTVALTAVLAVIVVVYFVVVFLRMPNEEINGLLMAKRK